MTDVEHINKYIYIPTEQPLTRLGGARSGLPQLCLSERTRCNLLAVVYSRVLHAYVCNK